MEAHPGEKIRKKKSHDCWTEAEIQMQQSSQVGIGIMEDVMQNIRAVADATSPTERANAEYPGKKQAGLNSAGNQKDGEKLCECQPYGFDTALGCPCETFAGNEEEPQKDDCADNGQRPASDLQYCVFGWPAKQQSEHAAG